MILPRFPAYSLLPIAAMTIVFALAVLYTIPAQPLGDEICRAALDTSGVEYAAESYGKWTGRWLSMFLYGQLLPGTDLHAGWYNFAILSGLVLWFGSFFLACSTILPTGRFSQRLVLASALLCTFWASTPSLYEVFYWLTGITEYALPFFVMTAVLFLAVRYTNAVSAALACLLAFCTGGLHELAGMVLCVALGALTTFAVPVRRTCRRFALILISAGAGLMVNLVAPGNTVRLSGEEPASLARLVYTLAKPDDSMLEWIVDPRVVLLSFFIILIPKKVLRSPEWTRAVPAWAALAAAVLMVNLPFAVVTYVVGGQSGAGRVLDFLFAVTMLCSLATAILARELMPPLEGTRAWRSAIAVLFGFSLLSAPQTTRALQNIPEAFGEFTSLHERAWTSLRTGSGDVIVPQIPAPLPLNSQFSSEFGPDPNWWANVCVAKYFGVRTVRTIPDRRLGLARKHWVVLYAP